MRSPSSSKGAGIRGYQSELRRERAAKTRKRILRAVVAVMNRDPAGGFTIPAVAKEAKVAVPTVYRHFANKEALVRGLKEEVDSRVLPSAPLDPGSGLEDGIAFVHEFFERYGELDPELKALDRTPMALEVRRSNRKQRAAWVEKTLSEQLEALPKKERAYMRDVVLVLTSSSSLRAFDEYLGLSPREAAKRVEWAIRMLAHSSPTK